MRLALILCTLSAGLCLVSALGQPEAPTKSSSSGYPKKVTTLKKRPTKTPGTATLTSSSSSSLSASGHTATTKPSKPRVKIASKTTTTKPPPLAASFGNLPADDLEFIKELDKQFKLHGGKIKIKVERDNSTSKSSSSSGGKNNKRTIDGELGYGYAHQGYDYTPPKFMFYPYSQHDIPATESPDIYTGYSQADYDQPGTTQAEQQLPIQHQQVTSVTIEPSYSYELKPQTSYETQHGLAQEEQRHGHVAEQPQIDLPQPSGAGGDVAGYQEPVIVLRIPGPAKYAAHLQTLLQQYLEIRAAQYLQLLQEAEQRKHPHQHEELSQPQQYATPEAHYHSEVSYAHQVAATPSPIQYAPIDDVYQGYKGRHQQYEQPAPEEYYAPTGYQQQHTQFYYAQPQQQPEQHQQQQHQQQQHQAHYESSYQPQLYLIAMGPQHQYAHEATAAEQQHQHQQPIYVPEQESQPAAEAVESAGHEHEHEHNLPITENNPRPTHTKVIFNAQNSDADYVAHTYPMQSTQSYAEDHQQHQQQQAESGHAEHVATTAADYQPSHEPEEAMAITQPPYNYHAHGLKMRQGKRAASREQAADHQLQQIREYVREKLGAEMGSAVEYKTTQLLEG